MKNPNILLGGVPFGCDNIGDEAILACIVSLLQQELPGATLMACTNTPKETARELGILTTPLYGFDTGANDRKSFCEALQWADVFIWSGATGLSDYPEAGLTCLEQAQQMNVKTIVFCTGMNDSLNPAHFRLGKGKKRTLLRSLNQLFLNQIDFVKTWEKRKEARIREQLKTALDQCALVINRDSNSRSELMRSNLENTPLVGADPAITLKPQAPKAALWGDAMMEFLGKHKTRIGICISSQQALRQQDRFALWLDQVVARHGCGIVFIPMNPITDFALMSEIREEMTCKEQSIIATGTDDPEHVAGLAQAMDIVISSRLHLLIFASVSATPCVGIGRGSKVSVFLKQMGQQTAGSTENIDFEKLDSAIQDIFLRPRTYHHAAVIARAEMLERLEKATATLGNVLRQIPCKSTTQSPKLVLEAQQ